VGKVPLVKLRVRGEESMGKANRTKGEQGEKGMFPLKMLHYWFKPTQSIVKRCRRCGERADYGCEHYLNVNRIESLVAEGMTRGRAVDKVWSEDLAKQSRGKYTYYGTTELCQECTATAVERAVAKIGAMVSLKSAQVGHLSFVLGCEVETPQDEGRMFATVLPRAISTIEDLSQLLKAKGVDLHLND
jgi:hypothetical protein